MDSKTVLVLGASSDLAIETLSDLPFAKAKVIAHYHSSSSAIDQLSSEIPHMVESIRADLSDDGEVKRLIKYVEKNYGGPDVVLHFAAPKLSLKRFHQTEWDDFDRELSVQVQGICSILQAFIPQMIKRHYGKVVFVLSSVVLGTPPKTMSPYVTAKYALLGLMKSLSIEYADKGLRRPQTHSSLQQNIRTIRVDFFFLAPTRNPHSKINHQINDEEF